MEYIWKTFSNCFFVKGFNRAAIYDLQRNTYKFAPLELEEIWEKFKDGVSESEFHNFDNEISSFFLKNEFIFKIPKNTEKHFPNLDLNYKSPNYIETIEVDGDLLNNNTLLKKLHNIVPSLQVENLMFLINGDFEKIDTLKIFNYTRIKSIVLVFTKRPKNIEKCFNLINNYSRITSIYLDFELNTEEINNIESLNFSIYSWSLNITKEKLIPNINLFIESQNHNSYLNKRIYIDSKGDIFNSFNNKTCYGNINRISNDELKELIRNDLKENWNVTKNKINICNVCEFRHMCTDKREINQLNGTWFYSQECSYNPYICKWRDEDGYLNLKESGIEISKEIINLDKKKIDKINNTLWEDLD